MLHRLIGRYIHSYRHEIMFVVVFQLVAATSSLLLPSMNGQIIDYGVATGNTRYIITRGLYMLLVAGIQGVCQAAAVYFAAQVAMSLGRDMRKELFQHTLSFSTREMNRFGPASLITRTTNDVQQVQMLVLEVGAMMISAPIVMIGGIVMAIRENAGLSWLILVAVILLGSVLGVLVARMTPLFQANQQKLDELNRITREQITGTRVIRAFNREPLEQKRFRSTNDQLMRISYAIGKLFCILFPFAALVINLGSVAVMWFGSLRVDGEVMQIGQLTAFLSYLMQILMNVVLSTLVAIMAPRAIVCARRITEVLDTDSSVHPPAEAVREVISPGTVSLRCAEFCYPGADKPVLSNISFDLCPGQTTAIVGSTGSGKTTLVNLIPRLFDSTKGTVSVGGVDVRKLDPGSLWSMIGLVPQKAYLFSGTVASNLRYGLPEATDDQMWEALRTAQAADFVAALEKQLDAPVAQGGLNLSGGQRQRLSIARALIKRPQIYIFDDAFSALDVMTESHLRAVLAAQTQHASVLIVAQRISTVRQADQIIVLDQGTIAGLGAHHELLESCLTYREIVESQMSNEEMA